MCPETQQVSRWGPWTSSRMPGHLLSCKFPGPTQTCSIRLAGGGASREFQCTCEGEDHCSHLLNRADTCTSRPTSAALHCPEPHELLYGYNQFLTLAYHVGTGGDTCEEHGLWVGARTQHSMLRMFPHQKKIHSSSLPSSLYFPSFSRMGPVGPGLTAEHEKFRGMPSGHRSLSEEKRKSNLLPQSLNVISNCTAAGGKFNSAAAPRPVSAP